MLTEENADYMHCRHPIAKLDVVRLPDHFGESTRKAIANARRYYLPMNQ